MLLNQGLYCDSVTLTIESPYQAGNTKLSQCFSADNHQAIDDFISFWNDKASIISRHSSTQMKYIVLGINERYLLDQRAYYSEDKSMFCKSADHARGKSPEQWFQDLGHQLGLRE